MRAAEEGCLIIPRAPPQHAEIAAAGPGGAFRRSSIVIGVPDIGDPLADITVDIVEAELIGRVDAARGAPARADAQAVHGVAIIRLLRRNFIAEGERAHRAGAAGEFPLGLAREAVRPAGRERKPRAIFGGVDPTDENGRQPRILLGKVGRAKVAELGDGDGRCREGETCGDRDFVRRPLGIGGQGIAGILAHREPAGRDIDHLRPLLILPDPAGRPGAFPNEFGRVRNHRVRKFQVLHSGPFGTV